MAPGPTRDLTRTESADLERASDRIANALAAEFGVEPEQIMSGNGEVVHGVTTKSGTPIGVPVNITP